MARTINVVVTRAHRVSLQPLNAAPTQVVELKTVPTLSPGSAPASTLEGLRDVEVQLEVEGSMPVYDEVKDKFEIRPLSFEDLTDTDTIDGGTF